MSDDKVVLFRKPEQVIDPLSQLLREGAQRLIAQAVEAELQEFLSGHAERRDTLGRQAVVRNGYLPEREVLTGIGPVSVRVPKVRDRVGGGVKFNSQLVPPYVRKSRSVEAALPWLYLKGISSGEMSAALEVLVGEAAKGLSAAVVSRLKTQWQGEYEKWRQRTLGKDRWVYLWADGIYSGLRAEDSRLCALVIVGVNEMGQKHLSHDRRRGAGIHTELAGGAAVDEGTRV